MIELNLFNDYSDKLYYNQDLIKNLICNILDSENNSEATISINFSNQNKLNKLKLEFFNLNHDTEVIPFNLEDKNSPLDGEVYISIDDVLLNAKKYNQTFNNECKRIIIHGVLHLIGYKDDTINNKKVMSDLEEKFLKIDNKELIKLSI